MGGRPLKEGPDPTGRRAYWREYAARRYRTDPAFREKRREAARRFQMGTKDEKIEDLPESPNADIPRHGGPNTGDELANPQPADQSEADEATTKQVTPNKTGDIRPNR